MHLTVWVDGDMFRLRFATEEERDDFLGQVRYGVHGPVRVEGNVPGRGPFYIRPSAVAAYKVHE